MGNHRALLRVKGRESVIDSVDHSGLLQRHEKLWGAGRGASVYAPISLGGYADLLLPKRVFRRSTALSSDLAKALSANIVDGINH